jgi:hypothetical protein
MIICNGDGCQTSADCSEDRYNRFLLIHFIGVRGGAVDWGTALQAGRSRARFSGIFHWHNPSGRTMAPEVDSCSKSNEYQEYFLGGKGGRCVGLTTLPPACSACLEIWEPHPLGTLRACPGL